MSLQASLSERLARMQFDCPVMLGSLSACARRAGGDRASAAPNATDDHADELAAVAVLSSH